MRLTIVLVMMLAACKEPRPATNYLGEEEGRIPKWHAGDRARLYYGDEPDSKVRAVPEEGTCKRWMKAARDKDKVVLQEIYDNGIVRFDPKTQVSVVANASADDECVCVRAGNTIAYVMAVAVHDL